MDGRGEGAEPSGLGSAWLAEEGEGERENEGSMVVRAVVGSVRRGGRGVRLWKVEWRVNELARTDWTAGRTREMRWISSGSRVMEVAKGEGGGG